MDETKLYELMIARMKCEERVSEIKTEVARLRAANADRPHDRDMAESRIAVLEAELNVLTMDEAEYVIHWGPANDR